MKKYLLGLLIILIFLWSSVALGEEVQERQELQQSSSQEAPKAQEEPTGALIRIGLAPNQTLIVIPVSGTEEKVLDLSSGTEQPIAFEGDALNFTWNGSQIVLNDLPVSAGPILLKPGPEFLMWNNHHYRGEFQICAVNGKLTLINQLPVEDYLKGVVPKEVSPGWTMASLKAQAIAARTFTAASFGRHAKDGFDLCTTTHCQVYGGADAETAATNQAVTETWGKVMVYQSKVINAFYHASGGGSTEDPKNVWGSSSAPYLVPVMDWDQNSPYFQWTRNIDWTQVELIVSKRYPKIGNLVRLEPAAFAENGRVLKIRVKGDRDEIIISGETLRTILSLPSSNIQLGIIYGPEPFIHLFWVHSTTYPEAVIVEEQSSGANIEFINPPWNMPDPWSWLQDKEPATLVVKGYGWGHRIGLSQWGAKGMADMGFNETQILEYYYPGIAVTNMNSVMKENKNRLEP